MTDTTPRFALPFIMPGQAQKEIYHNEALTLVDAALHASVEGGPEAVPPAEPEEGQSWIVDSSPEGAWSGRAETLATWTAGGWRFLAPLAGMLVWNKALACWIYWTGSGWTDGALPAARITIDGEQVVGPRLPEVASPSGGTVIDAEARAAVAAVIVTLKTHGLTD